MEENYAHSIHKDYDGNSKLHLEKSHKDTLGNFMAQWIQVLLQKYKLLNLLTY